MAKKKNQGAEEIKFTDLLQGPFTVTVPIRMSAKQAELLALAASEDDGRNTSQLMRLLAAKYLRDQGFAK